MKASKSIVPLEWMKSEEIQLIVTTLNSESLEDIKQNNVRLVGGCIRDIFCC